MWEQQGSVQKGVWAGSGVVEAGGTGRPSDRSEVLGEVPLEWPCRALCPLSHAGVSSQETKSPVPLRGTGQGGGVVFLENPSASAFSLMWGQITGHASGSRSENLAGTGQGAAASELGGSMAAGHWRTIPLPLGIRPGNVHAWVYPHLPSPTSLPLLPAPPPPQPGLPKALVEPALHLNEKK